MNVFLKTALITFFVFSIGLMAGVWLDLIRAQSIDSNIENTSLELMDVSTLQQLYDTATNSTEFCNAAISSNLAFNARVYEEGKQLDREEAVTKFSDMELKKKRYALLQMQFWLNAVKLKDKCNANYDTVVYFYKAHKDPTAETAQSVQSEVLRTLKEECGNRIMLVPLPMDVNITSIDTVTREFGISKAPSTLINEKVLIEGAQNINYMRSAVGC